MPRDPLGYAHHPVDFASAPRGVEGEFLGAPLHLGATPPSRLALAREIGRLEGANEALRIARDRLARECEGRASVLRRVELRLAGEKPDQTLMCDEVQSDVEQRAKDLYTECSGSRRAYTQAAAERGEAQRRCEELEKNLAASQLNAQVYFAALHRGASLRWLPDSKQFCASDPCCIFTADDLTVACEKFVAAKKEDEPHGA